MESEPSHCRSRENVLANPSVRVQLQVDEIRSQLQNLTDAECEDVGSWRLLMYSMKLDALDDGSATGASLSVAKCVEEAAGLPLIRKPDLGVELSLGFETEERGAG